MTTPRQLASSVMTRVLAWLVAGLAAMKLVVAKLTAFQPVIMARSALRERVAAARALVESVLARFGVTSVKALLGDLVHRLIPVFAITLLVLSMGGTWRLAGAAPPTIAEEIAASSPPEPERPVKKSVRALTGKINLNTATEEQLMLLPTVGPAKAERIVHWRKKNGGFRRTADLRRVKGFGFKTFKRLEPFLDIKGETTLK
jgi:competence ComEA-like helix-hairpin-helix protein